MHMQTIELRCPYCHAAQPQPGAGHHTCEFCLRGFTAVDAAHAQQQLGEQAGAWLRERIGPSGGAEVIDRASRGYIFNQRILPELRRDAARASEGLGAWLQAPLILPELARTASHAPHPLTAHGERLRTLVELRGRLDHEAVRGFAVDEDTRQTLATIETTLGELIYFINIAVAGEHGGAQGWRAVHTNLEALAQRGSGSGQLAALQGQRWQRLAALAGHYDDCAQGRHPPGQVEAIETIIADLSTLAEQLRTRGGSELRARATALAIDREAFGARVLTRWLRCRAGLPGARAHSLPHLTHSLSSLLPHADPEHNVALLESWTELASVARCETSIAACEDFTWVDGWAESMRRRKRFGLFGEDELVVAVERFLLPVWVVELGYSQRRGHLLGGGVEQRALALLDACACTPDKLAIFEPVPSPLREALSHPMTVSTPDLALPETTATDARAVVQQALNRHPERQNARFEVRGLALICAATVRLRTSSGERQVTAALHGRVPTSTRARERLDTGRWLFTQFAR